jgi:hypothetical protein
VAIINYVIFSSSFFLRPFLYYWGPPFPKKGGIFEICPRVSELWVQLLTAWVSCLKVTLQTQAAEFFRLC